MREAQGTLSIGWHMRQAPTQPNVDGLHCSQGCGNIMSLFLSVVRIITTLKKPAGHFVECHPPAGWKLGARCVHDILSLGLPTCLSSSVITVLVIAESVIGHGLICDKSCCSGVRIVVLGWRNFSGD